MVYLGYLLMWGGCWGGWLCFVLLYVDDYCFLLLLW